MYEIEVQEGGGVPVPQFAQLCNGLAGLKPGRYLVMVKPELPTDPNSPCQAICHGNCEMRSVEDCEQWDDWHYRGVKFKEAL